MMAMIWLISRSLYRPGEAISMVGSNQNLGTALAIAFDMGVFSFRAIVHDHFKNVAGFLVKFRHESPSFGALL